MAQSLSRVDEVTAASLSAWSLGTTTDPRRLVPGSPAGVRADASDLTARARSLAEVGRTAGTHTETPSWRGGAYESWTVRRNYLTSAHDAVSQVLSGGAWSLQAHADVLEWAQMRAGVAVTLWARGRREAQSGNAVLVPGRGDLGIAIRDAGAETREHAVIVLDEARAEVTASGAALAQVLDDLSSGLPDGRFHAGDFFAGIGSWFTGIASSVWQLSPTRFVLDREGWARALSSQADGVSETWDLLTEDPLNAPAALLDLATLEDRPGRWWGALAPDIALTAAGGLGLGTKATSLLQAGRWSRLGNATDALAVAGRAESVVTAGEISSSAGRLSAAQARIEERWPSHAVLQETSGQRGAWNSALHRPLPDTVYVVDDAQQIFATDSRGRVTAMEAEWSTTPKADADLRRNGYQQSVAGRDWREPGDVGGHLTAAGGGGPGEGINLAALDKAINGSGGAHGRMEADIRALAAEHPSSTIRLEVELDYPGASARPDYISASYYRDGAFVNSVEFDQ